MNPANMNPAKMLERVAVVGLQRQSLDENLLPQEIREVLPEAATSSPEARFLDICALTLGALQATGVSTSAEFDEIPALTQEDQPAITPRVEALLQELLKDKDSTPLMAALLGLAAKSRILTPVLLVPLMRRSAQDRPLSLPLQKLLGERGQWLARLNPEWSHLVAVGDQADENTSAAEWHQALRAMRTDSASGWARLSPHWQTLPADVRLELCRHLRAASLPASELIPLTQNEKSKHVLREILRARAVTPDSDVRRSAGAELAKYLDKASGLINKTVDIRLPEKLEKNLQDLGLSNQVHTAFEGPKNLHWLGNLLVLAGPDAIAELVGLNLGRAVAVIAKHKFGDHLCPFLLEVGVYHRNLDWIQSWVETFSATDWLEKGIPQSAVADVLLRCEDHFLTEVLTCLATPGTASPLNHPDVWKTLVQLRTELTPELSQHLFPAVLALLTQVSWLADAKVKAALALASELHLSCRPLLQAHLNELSQSTTDIPPGLQKLNQLMEIRATIAEEFV